MANQHVHEFTDSNFDSEVMHADQPVLVDFWAEWCMPCRMIGPTIDALAEEYASKIKVGKVDTDANRDVSMKFGITAIPTVILFQQGEVKKKFVGITSKEDFAAAIDNLVGEAA